MYNGVARTTSKVINPNCNTITLYRPQQMNFAQVIVAFALCAISFVSASLIIAEPDSGSSKIVGVAFVVSSFVTSGRKKATTVTPKHPSELRPEPPLELRPEPRKPLKPESLEPSLESRPEPTQHLKPPLELELRPEPTEPPSELRPEPPKPSSESRPEPTEHLKPPFELELRPEPTEPPLESRPEPPKPSLESRPEPTEHLKPPLELELRPEPRKPPLKPEPTEHLKPPLELELRPEPRKPPLKPEPLKPLKPEPTEHLKPPLELELRPEPNEPPSELRPENPEPLLELRFPAGTTKFNAIFTDPFNHKYVFSGLNVESPNLVTLTGMVGSYSVHAEAFDGSATISDSITFTLTLPSLSFTSPASSGTVPKISYGEPVLLNVATNGASSAQYTAIFTCAAGYFQITGLNTGKAYSIVPAGIYGNAIITVTAIDSRPATLSITITRSSANQPPIFIRGNPSFLPSIYANMQEDGNLEVLSVEYLNSLPSAPV
jgi:hypothetical protein